MAPSARIEGPVPSDGTVERVWYAAYGSNMHRARLDFYLRGGRPLGNTRVYPGCRDSSPPLKSVGAMVPGCVYFALESMAWTGGMAFYDATAPGLAAVHAYLLTVSQFSDIAAQEMHQDPGTDLDLSEVLATGRHEVGPGRYEAMIHVGWLEDLPVLTFTAPWKLGDVECSRPAERYVSHLASGLAEAHGWGSGEIADYLARCPGVAGEWTAEQVERMVRSNVDLPAQHPRRPLRGAEASIS